VLQHGRVIPGIKPGMSLKERAQAHHRGRLPGLPHGRGGLTGQHTYNTREALNQLYEECAQAREGVGKNGDWCVDFHQRFDLSDAVRGCDLIESLAPFFVEDPVRRSLRRGSAQAAAQAGEGADRRGRRVGQSVGLQRLVENHDIDYVRATLPNVGGITEMMKIAAICETHFVGIVPHFTGPIATAALVNSPGHILRPAVDGVQRSRADALPHCRFVSISRRQVVPNERPGLGVELDMKQLTQIAEVTSYVTNRAQTYFRPDGSITNW
jgi:galactonate dehydratase